MRPEPLCFFSLPFFSSSRPASLKSPSPHYTTTVNLQGGLYCWSVVSGVRDCHRMAETQARGAKRVRPDRQCLPETPRGRAFNHSDRVHCIADRRMRLSVSSGPCTLAEMLTRKLGLFVLRKFMLYFVWSFLKSSSCSTVLGFNLNSFVCLPPGTTDILYGREFFKVDGWNSGPRCVHSGIEVLEDPRRVFLNGGMLHLETLKAGLMMFVPLRPEPFFCPKNSQSFGGIISLAGIKKLLILLR